jgi:hypothetical protein
VYCVAAECGQPSDLIKIFDLGVGTCLGTLNNIERSAGCTTPFFEGTTACKSFAGSLTITMQYSTNVAGPYQLPDISKWLNQTGLGSLKIIKGTLSVLVEYSPRPPPVVMQPVFLTTLLQVGSLVIAECIDCSNAPLPPSAQGPVLAALPGLVNLRQMCSLDAALPAVCGNKSSISLNYTGFTSMASLGGLSCAPAIMTLTSPLKQTLTTLDGLQNLQPAVLPGMVFSAVGYILPDITALSGYAKCGPGGSTLTASFLLDKPFGTAAANCPFPALWSYPVYCKYISDGQCPIAPPGYARPSVTELMLSRKPKT